MLLEGSDRLLKIGRYSRLRDARGFEVLLMVVGGKRGSQHKADSRW
jgi:hypothetical protein